ncbi:unnamed protein product [Caenorhabditis auriculariae]|uniref:Uncharacterized protein n=1 Tax=Caenorhabditis auriculariae TaxID=2777116 RepID=A0A8S1HTQ5_9PELO|nr:unnamed protein product [Caenorhabditis auriculariae]
MSEMVLCVKRDLPWNERPGMSFPPPSPAEIGTRCCRRPDDTPLSLPENLAVDERLETLAHAQRTPQASPIPSDGWLIRMRANKYLNEAAKSNDLRKFKSVDELAKMEQERNRDPVDELHWQLRKEFHLTSYSQ